MKLYTLISFYLITILGFAQENYIIVNEDRISIEDFKAEYDNNIRAEGMDNAVDAYINFTLLQQEAKKMGLDTVQQFERIYHTALQPIRDRYLVDQYITDSLKGEIWKRLQTDRKVEVFAIGIQNKFDATEVDKRTKFVNDLHNTVCNKTAPNSEVEQYLNNSMQRKLWIRPFVLPSEIEQVAYQTPIASCSEVIASDNGNFFVKVLEERPSSGIVFFDYIFNTNKDKIYKAEQFLNSDSTWVDVKDKFNISSSLDSLNHRRKFEANIPLDLLEVVQHMDEGSFSDPISMFGGFYIIRLNHHNQFDELEEMNNWLTERIKESDYAMISVRETEKRAMKVVEVVENKQALLEAIQALGKNFFEQKDTIMFSSNEAIWRANDMEFTQLQFLREMQLARRFYNHKTNQKEFLNTYIPKFKQQFTLNTYIQNIEDYNPDYAQDALLLKNSILLDNYLETHIYNKAKYDTLGQKQYLKLHQDKYRYPKRYDIEMFRFQDQADGKKILKMLKKGLTKEQILNAYEGQRNASGAFRVVGKHGKFNAESNEFGKNFNPKKKYQISTFQDMNVVIKINEVLPERNQTWEEAGYVLRENYTKQFYEKTLEKLREDATIKVPATL